MRTEELYRKKICEMCGRVAYEKCIGKQVFDGGYTSVNRFEDSGFGSIVIMCHDLNDIQPQTNTVHVCTSCAQKLLAAVTMTIEQAKRSAETRKQEEM